MHRNAPFRDKNSKKNSGEGAQPLPDPPPLEKGTPSPNPTPSAPAAPRPRPSRSPTLDPRLCEFENFEVTNDVIKRICTNWYEF